VDKVQTNGLVVRKNAERSYFISKKGLDLSKSFEVGSTIIATVKKVLDDKTILSCPKQVVQLYPSLAKHYLEEEKLLPAIKAQAWHKSLQIGKSVTGKVSLIKDYGLIASLPHNLTGFILNANLGLAKSQYKIGDSIEATILDIDYEKEILDLHPQLPASSQFQIVLSKPNYLIGVFNNAIAKYILSPNEHQDQYIVGAIINNMQPLELESRI